MKKILLIGAIISSFAFANPSMKDMDLCQYLGHNFFRFLRIFFLKFYRA